jgi:hypothetical protein
MNRINAKDTYNHLEKRKASTREDSMPGYDLNKNTS